MSASLRKIGIQAALASAIFSGCAPIFGKQAILYGFSPLAVTAIRTTLAAVALLILMAVFKRSYLYMYPVGLIGCALAGFVNGIGSILYYSAISRLDASLGHLLYSFYPLFMAFWMLVDLQPISRITALRLVVALPGVYLLISNSSTGVDLIGAGMMIGSAVLYALHIRITQRILFEAPAQSVTLYTLMAMGLTVLIAYLLFDRNLPAAGTPWWPLIGMAFVTFFSRFTLFLGVKHLGGIQTALLGLGELLVTVVLAMVWLGERLTPLQWLGGFILVVSLLMVGFDRHPPEKRRSSGLLAWLNPSPLGKTDFPWQPHP
ncbi:DMT family transporter [Levilinea saccharolytica]|uniref:EamA domain-containing protein n=1 Tax=Levilinea saccharolytica TaxID=229921 RepID=A0A0P6XIE3_9CHLR|nr:DMT family transporter [Levilinea saccharolytica]KPL82995.1 hypothetical protein ADN01_08815 [Levilinea saccharolytica]GAP17826.1 permease [Levilinea saccharolytica]